MADYDTLETPLGPIFVGGSEAGVHLVKFVDQRESEAALVSELESIADAGPPIERERLLASTQTALARALESGAGLEGEGARVTALTTAARA